MANNNFNPEDMPSILQKAFNNKTITILLLAAIIVGLSSFFQVDTEEVGVVTRFGKYVRTADPGLNAKIPFAESVKKVPVQRQQKQEFGFRTSEAGVRTKYARSTSTTKDESLMLTGDLNLAEVEWVVQYRIDDPYNYLFKVRHAETTLRDVAEAAMRQIVGDRTVNEVLTIGRSEIASQMKVIVQDICKDYELGVRIDQVVLQDVNPPDPVKDAFNAVNEAQQQKETMINEAKSEYNKVIPKAKGQAEETVQKAKGYATERVNNAQGEVARFNELYKEYVRAPEVTKRRLYLETMQEVIPKIGNKIITDEAEGNNVLPFLNMKLKHQQ